MPGVLPSGLEELDFGGEFNQRLERVLPSGLVQLTLGYGYDCSLTAGVLPDELKTLTMVTTFRPEHELPSGLTKLDLHRITPSCHHTLPQSLTSISFGSYFDRRFVPGFLPLGLTNLFCGSQFNQRLAQGDLPASLIHIEFGPHFRQDLREEGVLPMGVEHLTFHQPHPRLPEYFELVAPPCHFRRCCYRRKSVT
jgi:hypothetical protein